MVPNIHGLRPARFIMHGSNTSRHSKEEKALKDAQGVDVRAYEKVCERVRAAATSTVSTSTKTPLKVA